MHRNDELGGWSDGRLVSFKYTPSELPRLKQRKAPFFTPADRLQSSVIEENLIYLQVILQLTENHYGKAKRYKSIRRKESPNYLG